MTEKEKIEELATLLLRSINKRKGQITMLDLASDMIQEGYSRQPEIVKCKKYTSKAKCIEVYFYNDSFCCFFYLPKSPCIRATFAKWMDHLFFFKALFYGLSKG